MSRESLFATLASLAACGMTTLGILVVRRFEAWAKAHSIYFVAFAAGVLIAVSMLHLAPESFKSAEDAPEYLFAGYLLLYIFNRLTCAVVCERRIDSSPPVGLTPLVGIGFHSLVDGVVYAVTFSVDTFTGSLAALGMVLHEFPEGVVTYVLIVRGGFSRGAAFWLAILAAGVTTPLGTLLAYPLMGGLSGVVLSRLLALSAGALLYVGASHLLPQVERERRRFSFLALAAGMATAVAIVIAK